MVSKNKQASKQTHILLPPPPPHPTPKRIKKPESFRDVSQQKAVSRRLRLARHACCDKGAITGPGRSPPNSNASETNRDPIKDVITVVSEEHTKLKWQCEEP